MQNCCVDSFYLSVKITSVREYSLIDSDGGRSVWLPDTQSSLLIVLAPGYCN